MPFLPSLSLSLASLKKGCLCCETVFVARCSILRRRFSLALRHLSHPCLTCTFPYFYPLSAHLFLHSLFPLKFPTNPQQRGARIGFWRQLHKCTPRIFLSKSYDLCLYLGIEYYFGWSLAWITLFLCSLVHSLSFSPHQGAMLTRL